MNQSEAPSFSVPSLPLAVVVTSTKWDEPPRIRHQVTRQLMRGFNVLYIEFLPCDSLCGAGGNLRKIHDRLVVLRPNPGRLPNVRFYANISLVHKSVNRRYATIITSTLTKYGSPSLLCSFVPAFPEVMDVEANVRIYFCYDEWPRMWRRATKPNSLKFEHQSRLMSRYENRTAEKADICLVSHTPLRERLSRINTKSLLFLHGHEFKSAIPSDRSACSKVIRVAYMGYITYNLLLDWMFEVLKYPDIELNLIGPIHRFEPSLFSEYPNFRHSPPMVGVALQKKLMETDVLIMPYNPEIPEVHVQTVSNKFFQYVAAGRPIVISDMPYYIDMPDGVIYRAKTAGDFVTKIRQAHTEDCDEFRKLRAKIAAENTWDKRGEQLHGILKDALGDIVPELDAGIRADV